MVSGGVRGTKLTDVELWIGHPGPAVLVVVEELPIGPDRGCGLDRCRDGHVQGTAAATTPTNTVIAQGLLTVSGIAKGLCWCMGLARGLLQMALGGTVHFGE